MKAPDIVESWKWQHGEKIIERLLGLSNRTIGVQTSKPASTRPKDRYYVAARKHAAMRAAKEAMGR